MKLSLALLSILQNPTAGSGSGEGSEDFYEIESCFTVYMPKSKLSGISSIGGFCSAVNSGYDSVLSGSSVNKVYAGCFDSCTGNGIPNDGSTASGDPYDSNSNIAALAGTVSSSFANQDGTTVCVDICADLSGYGYSLSQFLVSGDHLTSADYAPWHQSMEDITKQAVESATSGARSGDIEVTTIKGNFEVTNEASGDGEVTTTAAPVITTTAPDGSTDAVTDASTVAVTTTPAPPEMFGYKGCISLYFPVLWIVQTMFPGLFDFCPIFGSNFCKPFDAIGAPCWMNHCDAVCRGDGTPDYALNDDEDSAAANANDNKGTCFDKQTGAVLQEANDNKSKFGCFDFCFEVHMTQAHMDAITASRDFSRTFSFTEADVTALAEEIADDAMVTTVIQGPNVDTTNLGNTNAGYTCVDPAQTDVASCLVSDTTDAGFTVPVNGDASSVVAETLWGAESQTTLSGINCADSNGGCSHTCSGEGLNGVCSCPNQCWQLDVDQKTCNIHPDMVQLTCHPDRMEAHLAKCVVAGTDAYQLGNSVCSSTTTTTGDAASTNPSNAAIIEHATCASATMGVDADVNGDGVNDNGCLTFVVGLDECSMQVNADYANNKLTFMQELVSTDFDANQQTNALGNTGTNALVNFDPRVSVDFTCEYTADYVTDSAEVTTNPDEVTNNLQSTGVFGYALKTVQPSLQDFNDLGNTWTDVHSTADGRDYMVGSTLYFQVCDQQELSNVYFSVPECTVYNDDMTESYQIITDHCPDQFVNTQRVGRYYDNRFMTWNADSDKAGFIPMPTGSTLAASDLATNQCLTFSYTVFEFVSNADQSADLKLSCKVKACEYSENNPDNMASCIDNTCAAPGGRKRRSLTSEKYTTVTQSFRVTRPKEE